MDEFELSQKFPNLQPLRGKGPTLMQFNGIGPALVGKRDEDPETGTYVKNHAFALLSIPLLFLGAYRVAEVSRGRWNLIGREPLSGPAQIWNVIFLVSVIGLAGFGGWKAYTSTPTYQANKQMEIAKKEMADGSLAAAAERYAEVSREYPDRRAEVESDLESLLVDSPPSQSPGELKGLMEVAVDLSQSHDLFQDKDLTSLAITWSESLVDSAPQDALGILDAVKPLVVLTDEMKFRAARLPILEALVVERPDDVQVVGELASVLWEEGKVDESRALLEPIADQLQGLPTARILGAIDLRDGNYARAVSLLQGYVDQTLPNYLEASRNLDKRYERLVERSIEQLEDGDAGNAWYNQYDRAETAEQEAMVDAYIQRVVENDATLNGYLDTLNRDVGALDAALELGIGRLQLARELPPGAADEELERAEQAFLAIRDELGDSDEYQLYLGQVYFWLGRSDEGTALFNALLKRNQRDPLLLLTVADTYRSVGNTPAGRELAEEAYAAAKDDQTRFIAASTRAAMLTDSRDYLEWARRMDPDDPNTKAGIAGGESELALLEGRLEEAERKGREAIALYDDLPQSPANLNNSALVFGRLFEISGDREDLEASVNRIADSVEALPDNTTLMGNLASNLLVLAAFNELEGKLDFATLQLSPAISQLSFLTQDTDEFEARWDAVSEGELGRRAESLARRLVALAPQDPASYNWAMAFIDVDEDPASAEALLAQAIDARVGEAADRTSMEAHWSGENVAEGLADVQREVERLEALIPTLDATSVTHAVAVSSWIANHLSLETMGAALSDTQMDRLVQAAEALAESSPSIGSSATLESVYCRRAIRHLNQDSPELAEVWSTHHRFLSDSAILAVVAKRNPDLRSAMQTEADIARLGDLYRERSERSPESSMSSDLPLIDLIDPELATELRRRFETFPGRQVEMELSATLNPLSSASQLAWANVLTHLGRANEAQAVLDHARSQGVPLP